MFLFWLKSIFILSIINLIFCLKYSQLMAAHAHDLSNAAEKFDQQIERQQV